MDELFNVNQRLHNFLTKQQRAGGNTTDENRSIGTQATLNNKDVYWSGQNYGWQSQDSYNKLKEGPEFRAGHIGFTRIGTDLKQGSGMVVDAGKKYIPEQVKSTALDVVRQGVQAYQGLPQNIRTGINNTAEVVGTGINTFEQGFNTVNEAVSKTTNISPIYTGHALTLGTDKASKAVKPLTKAGLTKVANSLPAETAHALTIKNPDRIAGGIRQGSAKSSQWKDAMREWGSRRAQLKEQLETAAYEGKSTGKIIETAYNDVSTGPTRLLDNEPAYKVDKYKEQSVIQPLTKKGNTNWQQQHHLFPKQESYQFVERMAKLGDDDDVLNLFLYAEEMDAVMGGRLLNMLNMEDLPHSVLHSSRSRKIDGRQLQAIKMKNLVDNAKSTDELMDMFHDYIVNNIEVSKNQAYALNEISKRMNKKGQWKSLNILREKNFMGKNPKL